MSGFGEIENAQYVSLTTFRKDGTPVPTPLWAAADGDRLVMWTPTESWKVKRLRRDPRVVVQACDRTGKKLHGTPVEGTGEILDDASTARVRDILKKKYGILGWLIVTGSLLRRGGSGTIGLALTATRG